MMYNAGAREFSTHISELLYTLGVTPNEMTFWVMTAAANAVFEEPFRLTALRDQLYPEIERYTGMTPESIDGLLRRTCKRMMKDESFAPLRAYLPNGAKTPPSVGVFLSAWIRMASVEAWPPRSPPKTEREEDT